MSERPALPRGYTTILVVEVAVLSALLAAQPAHPPFGYELGWAGVASMLVMQVYSLRRRVRALSRLGSLRAWLDAHIFLGFQGFIFVAYHSVGITAHASLAACNFALVATVVATGVFGRYLYGFIARARACRAAELGHALPPELVRECRGIVDLVRLDLARRRLLTALARDPYIDPMSAASARRQIALASRISGLEVADRWFSRWTLLHRPLSVLLVGITTLHVLAHFAYAP
jgi:hypothetical protein